MRTFDTPKNGYAFKHKITGEPSFVLFIGTGDNIDNYVEITEEEYNQIMEEKSKRMKEREIPEFR